MRGYTKSAKLKALIWVKFIFGFICFISVVASLILFGSGPDPAASITLVAMFVSYYACAVTSSYVDKVSKREYSEYKAESLAQEIENLKEQKCESYETIN